MGRFQQPKPFKRFGSFHIRYYASENGVRKQKSQRLCTIEEGANKAKQLAADFLAENVNVGAENAGPMGVVEFWDEVYEKFLTESSDLKPSTIQGYQQVWKQHLKSHFGTTCLHEYRTHQMSNFLTSLAKKLRPRTLDRIKWLASAIFAHAVATGHCEANPCRDARVLCKTLGNGDTEVYSLEEIENIISALVDHVEAQLIMALAFFLGLRKGEIQGLQWSDIDNNFIHIRRAIVRGHIGTPKTKKSVRRLPIIEPVGRLLKLWRAKAGDGVWVFDHNLMTTARAVIIPTLEKNNLVWKGFQSGRRGCGTELRALTGNSTAGQNVFGHTTTQTTEQHYEHALPEEALRGLRLLEAKAQSK